MLIHLAWDITALLCSFILGYYFRRHYKIIKPAGMDNPVTYHYYLIALLLGLTLGSVIVGTANLYLAGKSGIAKSMLGGLIGAIVSAELFKLLLGLRYSTGFYFVPSLLILMIIGRLGCFWAGLEDFTYGTATTLPWGIDFGDGIKRHPVQLYESLTLAIFLVVILNSYNKYATQWQQCGFYGFVLFYASQRFIWEYFKPYPLLVANLNLFQCLSLSLIFYAVWMLWRQRKLADKPQVGMYYKAKIS